MGLDNGTAVFMPVAGLCEQDLLRTQQRLHADLKEHLGCDRKLLSAHKRPRQMPTTTPRRIPLRRSEGNR